MATNIIRDNGEKTIIDSVGAAYSSGDFIVQGRLHGVSLNDVDSGDDAAVQATGEITYTKAAGAAWTEGDALYFDTAHDRFTTIATADGLIRGRAAEDALLAATTGKISLCEAMTASIAEFMAYDNSTSGLAATDVQAAIDEVEDRVDDVEADKMDLVSTPTAGNLIEMDAVGQGVDSGLASADVQVLTVPAAAGNLAELDAAGALADSGVASADVQVLTVPAAAGNLAELDAAGALADSGVASADVQVLTVPAAAGNLAELDAAGALADSGVASADVQVLTVPAAAGNLAELDAAGALADSGVASADVQVLTVPAVADSIAGLNAAGELYDSTVLVAGIADAVDAGTVHGDQMRNSTNTAQSLADATATIIDLEDVELAGNITYAAGTTSLATIPADGMYTIVWSAVFVAGAGTYNSTYLYVNGAPVSDDSQTPDNANPITSGDSETLFLLANDTVALWAKQDSGGALNVTAARLAIQRIQ